MTTPILPPITISWTALRAHEECKQRSSLYRAGKRNPAADMRNFFHGMVVDTCMRRWLSNPDRGAGEMKSMVDDIIDSEQRATVDSGSGVVRWRHASDRADLRDYCMTLVDRLEPHLRQHVLPYEFDNGLRFKVPLTLPVDDQRITITLSGEVDLLVHRDDGPVIWDLKGTRDSTYWRKTLGQLVFYDIAHTARTGTQPVACGFIQPMCDEQILTFVLDGDARRELLTRILRMAADIYNDSTTCTTASSKCVTCDVKHGCARFQPETGRTMSLDAPDTLAEALRARAAKEKKT